MNKVEKSVDVFVAKQEAAVNDDTTPFEVASRIVKSPTMRASASPTTLSV